MQNQKRQEIIEAIKATAKANDGIPLGVRAFQTQTGIKVSDWKSVYWVRWGDALQEAGFSPNAFNDKRMDQSSLLDKLIPAIRHFKRIPTVAEMRFYSRTISKLPSDGTVRNHFATNADLITALAAYVAEKSDLQDIANLCRKIDLPQKNIVKPIVNEGHVYLFKSGNYYKIGRTDNLERRVKEVTVALPESLTIVHTIRTDDPEGIEAYWHRRFSDCRAKGEWFKLSASDILAFKRRKFQ